MALSNIISIPPSNQKGHSPVENKAFSQNESQTIITACRAILATSLPKYFDFFEKLDDSLFNLAEQTESNTHKEEYFAVMRKFRLKQDAIKKQFISLVLADFDSMSGPSAVALTSESTEDDTVLSLMDNDVLEEDIALKKITTKAEDACRYEINQLDKRFAALLKQELPQKLFSLVRIIEHLKTVISQITDDITIKLITYKLFEKESINELVRSFQLINDELIKQGVLPKLKLGKRKSPSASKDLSRAKDEHNDDAVPAIFEELRQLQAKGLGNSAGSESNPTGEIATLSTLVSTLSHLQSLPEVQPSYNEHGKLVLPDLRQSLQTNLSQTQADGSISQQSVSRIDDDTINVVSFLFEFILEDLAIPTPIRALLARLQLPMLKVAISDKTFFSQKSHAARRLLNSLAKVSTGWQHKGESEDTLFNIIDSIVNTVLSDFDDDISLFDTLNSQLNHFVEQHDQKSNVAEKRVTQASEGQEKRVASQQYVDNAINQLLSQYSPVPTAVLTLINEDWRKVLNLRLLQKGKDSTEWKQAIELMEKLLWSVRPKTDDAERKELIATIPTLLKSLRSSLSGASFTQHKITKHFKDLQACHLQCLSGKKLAESELQDIESQEGEAFDVDNGYQQLASIPSNKKVLSDEEALIQAKDLATATWLEITENEESQRIKFSWRSNLTGRCLFVNYKGLKAAEYSLSELAGLFQKGQAVIIDSNNAPLMDRALVSMKETIDQQGDTVTA